MNRRSFLSAIPAVAFVASPALPDQTMTMEQLCDYHAEKLRDAMQALHGGKWQWAIGHDYGLAHINIVR